ncbi:reprolysin-like metallopeptidase [Tahibacter amnicola]|uniref:M12 family metallo-peptidase n=1 Tax=Tahibacter amnicola TaxID=2976241 RepID=A0ABY6BDK5_9GAMM|nr:zinc-dependent metalloprotease family protein [Tahibacter amnicola]UXI68104.1 M12 family metallo-peptidase [Tahibacter amnicola]
MFRPPYFAGSLGLLLLASVPATALAAGDSRDLWTDVAPRTMAHSTKAEPVRTLQLDVATLRRYVADQVKRGQPLAIPTPEGQFSEFTLEDAGTMPPELAARFPDIISLMGTDAKGNAVRVNLSPLGFEAMVFDREGGAWVVEPEQINQESSAYRSFRRADVHTSSDFRCAVHGAQRKPSLLAPESAPAPMTQTGNNLRTMRIAIAATGEYTAEFGGTVAGGLAAINTALNRINQVYQNEFSVRMTLVANNSSIVYINSATDPYTDDDPDALISQNQSNIDSVIGSSNYDVGHVFSTGGGGLAGLGVICSSGAKARGVTGSSNPVGDPFYIDYVAHELGHQFDGDHTFNSETSNCGGGNRESTAAYEPGSGSTIMAYAGICGSDDLQPNSDPYFHARSIEQIHAKLTATSCGSLSVNPNAAPVVTPLTTSYAIPAKTPFMLTASATDANGDSLTYDWEEYDLGGSTAVNVDNGTSPILRSFSPTTSGTRVFPKLSALLSNTSIKGELLPQTARSQLKFRVTVRDNRSGGGRSTSADMPAIQVVSNGPFAVTAPNTAVTWSTGSSATVTWNTAGTTSAPVSCSAVDITLSQDGGNTFPIVLAANVANNGSAGFTVPAGSATTQARVRVMCRNNIFFDISNVNFTITGSSDQIFKNGFQ